MSEYRFLLHIGANKTGTSSIQRMLFENREALAAAGWEYPDFHLLYMAHHRVAYSLSRHPGQGLEGDWMAEFRALTADPAKRYIVSSELFFRTVDPRATAQLFPPGQTRVVLYLRDHLGYMMSWYAQAVQERNLTACLTDYVRLFSQSFSSYLATWDEVYGRDHVIVRDFHRDRLTGGDARLDFLAWIDGLDPATMVLPGEESNLSISGNLLFFKKILNNYMTYDEAASAPIPDEFGAFAAVKDSFSGRFRITEDEAQIVRTLFRDDLRALQARGVELTAPSGRLGGHPCPDFDTLRDDVKLIKEVAERTGKRFLLYADRWQDWHSL